MPVWAWHWAGYLIAAAALLVLVRVLVGDRARGRRRCRRCWYDLSEAGEPPLVCPECGREHGTLRQLTRTRRRRSRGLIVLLLLVIGYASWTMPRVLDRGWRGAVPTTVLAPLALWLPRSWHDEPFYITGEAGQQHEHLQAMVNELNGEFARVSQQTPKTLAEELQVRWDNEPVVVHRIANRIWDIQAATFDLTWHWQHGIRESIGIARLPYFLRELSYKAGHLSDAQGIVRRRAELARISPRMAYLGAIDRIGIEASIHATMLTTPDTAAVESRLVEGCTPQAVSMNRAIMLGGPGRSRGGQAIGPIDLDARRVVIEYTLLDADGASIAHHVVAYEFEFFELPPEQAQKLLNRGPMAGVMGNIWPVEVDGQPVRVPTRARRGDPIEYQAR